MSRAIYKIKITKFCLLIREAAKKVFYFSGRNTKRKGVRAWPLKKKNFFVTFGKVVVAIFGKKYGSFSPHILRFREIFFQN